MNNEILIDRVTGYTEYLPQEERSINTVSKYAHDIRALFTFLAGMEILLLQTICAT